MEQTNIERVQANHATFGAGDVERVLAALAPASCGSTRARPTSTTSAPVMGASKWARVFAIIARDFAIEEFVPLRFFAADDDVAVLLRLRATMTPTGRVLEEQLVHVWTLRADGLVSRVRNIQDSITA